MIENRAIVFIVGVGVGTLAGFATTSVLIRRRLEAEFEERLEREIVETRRFYKALKKKPVTDISVREKPESNDYSKIQLKPRPVVELVEEESPDEVVVDDTPYPRTYEERDDRLAEKYKRKEPFSDEDLSLAWSLTITEEEFFGNETDFEQSSWTYFSEDDVMSDERNEPITNWQDLVDRKLIEYLDSSATAETVIYVRDKYREIEYEITLDPGSYTSTLGIEEHIDERHRPRVMKFRSEDE